MQTKEAKQTKINEAILSFTGKNVFSSLKYESGVHRVQRVPQTETQGRIHTSASTVAVLPMVEEVELEIGGDIIDKHDIFQKQWLKRKAFYDKQEYSIIRNSNTKYTTDVSSWKKLKKKGKGDDIAKKVCLI